MSAWSHASNPLQRFAGLTRGQQASLACTWEVTAPKPGNVHRSADFADMSLNDFLASAIAIGPAMDGAHQQSLGSTVSAAMEATRALVDVNTNLGIVLLLAPLAAVDVPTTEGLHAFLQQSNAADCRQIYAAIQAAAPGGLGKVAQHDVADAAPEHILKAMAAAAERDMIARQYTNGFADVLDVILPNLHHLWSEGVPFVDGIVRTHLVTLAAFPDSLIARKCGTAFAGEVSQRAAHVLERGPWNSATYLAALEEFDFWLRCDGNRRNPGTTADLIAAALFAGLRLESTRNSSR